MKHAFTLITILAVAKAATSPFQLQGTLAPSGSFMDSLFHGTYDLLADIYYELKNEGFYSVDVYEGYVNRPVIEVAAAGSIDLDVKLFGLLHIQYKT